MSIGKHFLTSVLTTSARRYFRLIFTANTDCTRWSPLIFSKIRDIDSSPVGEGDSHMKQTGMLVVSFRGVNFGFWSRLGCSGYSTNILSRQETQNYAKRNRSQIFFLTRFLFVFMCFQPVSFGQIVSFRGHKLEPRPDGLL